MMSELARDAAVPQSTRVDARPIDADANVEPGSEPANEPRPGTITIRLFDADRTDKTLDLDEALGGKVGDRQLLWIDVDGMPDAATATAIAERLALRPMTRGLLGDGGSAGRTSRCTGTTSIYAWRRRRTTTQARARAGLT